MSSTLRLSQPPRPASASPGGREGQKVPREDSIVYLIQEPTIPKYNAKVIDITPLMWWGKIKVLMERTQVASFRPAQAYIQLRERLKPFDPQKDFIAVAGGDSLAVMMAGSILAQDGHDYFYYLRFERTRLPDGTRDPTTGAYVPIYVPITPKAAAMKAVL